MKKIKNIICIVLFAAFVLIPGTVCFLKEPVDVLISERRKAAQLPVFSVKNVINKSYFDGIEDFVTDQFPLRDGLRAVNAAIRLKLFGQKDNGGIYLADGHISELQTTLNEESVAKTADKLNSLHKKYLEGKNTRVFCSVIPDKNYYLAESNGYPAMDYEKMIDIFTSEVENMEYINIFDCLDIDSYYKTDSHWKQEKLDAVVSRLGDKMGFDAKSVDEYTAEKLADFEGVYSSRLAFGWQPDEIIALTDEVTLNAKVTDIEKNESYTGVYNKTKLSGNDRYDVFLSGATALISAENPYSTKKRELVIFRDSFGSSLAPLLLSGYSKITLVDIRYMSSQILDQFVDFENCDVLFLYNTQILNQSSMLK